MHKPLSSRPLSLLFAKPSSQFCYAHQYPPPGPTQLSLTSLKLEARKPSIVLVPVNSIICLDYSARRWHASKTKKIVFNNDLYALKEGRVSARAALVSPFLASPYFVTLTLFFFRVRFIASQKTRSRSSFPREGEWHDEQSKTTNNPCVEDYVLYLLFDTRTRH